MRQEKIHTNAFQDRTEKEKEGCNSHCFFKNNPYRLALYTTMLSRGRNHSGQQTNEISSFVTTHISNNFAGRNSNRPLDTKESKFPLLNLIPFTFKSSLVGFVLSQASDCYTNHVTPSYLLRLTLPPPTTATPSHSRHSSTTSSAVSFAIHCAGLSRVVLNCQH